LKAETSREWLNIMRNTPADQKQNLNTKAAYMLSKDASSLLSEHLTHLKPYYND
jgi:hypothetical protein